MMRKMQNLMGTIVLITILMFTGIFTRPGALAGPAAPTLLTAAAFAVLGYSTVTNTGPTTVDGDLGVYPSSGSTGFPPGIVTGTIHTADAVALQAQTDVTAAYTDLAGRGCTTDYSGTDLGGLTLPPGVYCFSSSAQLTGKLILDAQDDPNAVFIFKIGSTLTTGSNSSVTFINGANQCNVYWQVGSSATIGTYTEFAGNILALASITLNTGANVVGRVLALTGAVTLDTNNISYNQCLSAPMPNATATAYANETATSVAATATSVANVTATSVAATATAVANVTATSVANATATAVANVTATSAPTTAPTSAPTAAPTSAPTTVPTSATAAPTSASTVAPTSAPTVTPTRAPTVAATRVPAVVSFPATGGAAPRNEYQSAPQATLLMPTPVLPLNWQSIRYLAGTNLYANPIDLPLELWIPSLKLLAPVLGVGITSENVMDAPGGSPEDSVWQKVYWYRGSGIPGDLGTATIAGHVIDILGRPAVFASLKDLVTGNLIIVHDTRNGLSVRFLVVKTELYSLQQASDPKLLEQIYGIGPVSGKGPQPALDGRSHLTLITCGGEWINGSYDSRLVVYAERLQTTLKEKPVGAESARLNRFIHGMIW